MTNIFYGKSVNGEIVWGNKKSIFEYLSSVEGKDLAIKIDREKAIRSDNQHRFYWFYLRIIAIETGHTEDELHQLFKRILLPPTFIKVLGREMKIPATTRNLNKAEFGEYMDKISAETNIPIPDPKKVSDMISVEYPDEDSTITAF